MADPHDPLEQELDRLSPPVSAPPPAFLKAVGRRRTERRVRQASFVFGAILVLGAGAFLLNPWGTPVAPVPGPPIAFDSAPLRGTIGSMARTDGPAIISAPSGHRWPQAPVIYAADWRSEQKLAALAGRS